MAHRSYRAAMVFTTGAKGDARGADAESFAPDFAKNHPNYGRGRRAGRSVRQVFLELNFRCYFAHSISGSKIIENFPVVYNEAFFALSRVAHSCASWSGWPAQDFPLCLTALGAIGRILLQLGAKPIAICKV